MSTEIIYKLVNNLPVPQMQETVDQLTHHKMIKKGPVPFS